MFAYEKLLSVNSIEESDLPASIQELIEKLHELDYELDPADDDFKELFKDIAALDKEICQLITDHLDDESEEDLPAEQIKANILSSLYQTGIRKVDPQHLKKAGYPLPTTSKWQERAGNYQIRKDKFENFIHLSKVA